MTTISPTPLNLDEEQIAALTALHQGYEVRTDSVEEFLSSFALTAINRQVKINYDAAIQTLGEKFSTKPWNERQAIIQELNSKI